MKQLEISKLMDDYVDNEFCPEEGSAVSAAAVKARVLAQASPAKKRRMPRWKTALIAAALAAGALLSIAAAFPVFVSRQVDGSSMVVEMDGEHYLYIGYDVSEWKEPIVLENGRLWLVVNSQRTDITDLIDEETPYIVEGADPKSGLKSYLIVGGTPENFGWAQWSELPLGEYTGGSWNSYTDYFEVDGELVDVNDWWAENGDGITTPLRPGVKEPEKMVHINKAWYVNGNAKLHLWD